MKKLSVRKQVRALFEGNSDAVFSVEEIIENLGVERDGYQTISVYISRLKNPKYSEYPLALMQVEGVDGVKRWGSREAHAKNFGR